MIGYDALALSALAQRVGNVLKITLKAVFLTAGLVAGQAVFTVAQAQTLTDALIQAYQTNPLLRVNRAALRSVDESVAQARAALRPQISGSVQAQHSTTEQKGLTPVTNTGNNSANSLQVSLNASLLLFDGGASKAAINSARMNVLASRHDLINAEQSVLLDAVTAYMNMHRDSQFVQLAQNNTKVLQQEVRAAQDRFDVGEVTRTDVSQAEARLAAAKGELVSRQSALETSRQAYKAVIGTYPKYLSTPPAAPKLPNSPAAAETIAVSKHPQILGAHFRAKAAAFDLERANKNYTPTISAGASLSATKVWNNSNQTAGSVGLTANVPIYNGGSLSSVRRQAKAILDRRNAEVQQAGYLVRQGVRSAYAGLLGYRASIIARQEQVRSARIAFEGVREEAKFGARTTLDALDAEQEVLNARSNLVSAQRDEYVAAYTVLAQMGLLTAEHLGLGIETYNPNVNYKKVHAAPFDTQRSDTLDKILKRRNK